MNKQNWTWIIGSAIVAGLFAYLWRQGQLQRLRNYALETREELRKCTWPTWIELRGHTLVVMVTVAIIGVFTMGVDFIIAMAVRLVMITPQA